jgi:uncharacterized membrane protein
MRTWLQATGLIVVIAILLGIFVFDVFSHTYLLEH